MHIIINHSSMIPIYEQIVEAIKEAILSNQLSPNEALPSVRALSKELKISALTVKKAYDFLEKEGYTPSAVRFANPCAFDENGVNWFEITP